MEVADDGRQRGGDDRLIERGQEHAQQERTDDDQHLATRQVTGGGAAGAAGAVLVTGPGPAPPWHGLSGSVPARRSSSPMMARPSSSGRRRVPLIRRRAWRSGARRDATTASLTRRTAGRIETTVRRRSRSSSRRSTRPASASWVTNRLVVLRASPSRAASSETERGPTRAMALSGPTWRGARCPSAISSASGVGDSAGGRGRRDSREKVSSTSAAHCSSAVARGRASWAAVPTDTGFPGAVAGRRAPVVPLPQSGSPPVHGDGISSVSILEPY